MSQSTSKSLPFAFPRALPIYLILRERVNVRRGATDPLDSNSSVACRGLRRSATEHGMVGELFTKSPNSCIFVSGVARFVPLGKPPRFVVVRQRPRTDIAHNLACDYAAQVKLR